MKTGQKYEKAGYLRLKKILFLNIATQFSASHQAKKKHYDIDPLPRRQ